MNNKTQAPQHLPCHDGHDYRFHGDFTKRDDKSQRMKVWKCSRCPTVIELFMPAINKVTNAPDAGNPAQTPA